MSKKQDTNIRMSYPEDTFNKRQFPYLGEAFHEMHNLPGKYLRTIPTEMIKGDGSILRGDVAYLVMMPDASIQIINVEDESFKVKKEELEKAYGYKTVFVYNHWIPVLTVITTTVPEEKCLKELKFSKTDSFKPCIKSLPYDDAWDDLNIMIDKIKNQELFTKSDGLKFITLPRCCKSNQELAVEKICEVLLDMKVENRFILIELVHCMQCMIHKYAKTDKDILRLQEMIGLKEIKIERMNILDEMKAEGRAEGRIEGRTEGRAKGIAEGRIEGIAKGRIEGIAEGETNGKLEILNAMANDPESKYTVKELSEKFGFTEEQIINGK